MTGPEPLLSRRFAGLLIGAAVALAAAAPGQGSAKAAARALKSAGLGEAISYLATVAPDDVDAYYAARLTVETTRAACYQFDELKSKVGKGVSLKTPESALVIEGAGVRLEKLELDGALTIKACPGAFVTVKGLVVKNKGWRFTECGDDAGEVDRLRGFVVEKDETEALVFDKPGNYTVP